MTEAADSENHNEAGGKETNEAVVVFERVTEEIRFLKRQQWSITNYIIAAYVGIVAVSSILKDGVPSPIKAFEFIVLALAALAAMIIGFRIIRRLDKDLTKNRHRINRAIKRLPQAFEEIWISVPLAEREDSSTSISWALRTAIVFGGLAVIYLLLGRPILELLAE
ncbi:MAG: hypothetical protein ACC700_19140 [Anaerolineales bacterium]